MHALHTLTALSAPACCCRPRANDASICQKIARQPCGLLDGTYVGRGWLACATSSYKGTQETTRRVRNGPFRIQASSHDQATSVEAAETSEYALSFLWLDKNLAVAVDQVFGRGHRSPITEYYWWPREDAWESLKKVLDEREAKAWIRTGDKVKLLNTLTDVIHYWASEEKPTVRDAINKYPGCSFQG